MIDPKDIKTGDILVLKCDAPAIFEDECAQCSRKEIIEMIKIRSHVSFDVKIIVPWPCQKSKKDKIQTYDNYVLLDWCNKFAPGPSIEMII